MITRLKHYMHRKLWLIVITVIAVLLMFNLVGRYAVNAPPFSWGDFTVTNATSTN